MHTEALKATKYLEPAESSGIASTLVESQAAEAISLVNLLELQRRMAEDVMRPLTSDSQMQPLTTGGRSMRELADSYIKPNELLSSFDRLEIYNRQYWFRVIGAVAEDFPALNAVLGEKVFDRLVLAYLRDNPSTSFTLRNTWLEAAAMAREAL